LERRVLNLVEGRKTGLKPADELPGSAIIRAIKDADVEFVLAVPDFTTSEGLLFPIADDPALKLVRVCKEDEAVGISAGLSYCNRRSLVLIQHTGLLDSINALRGVAVEFGLPICMMVGLLKKEPGVEPTKSSQYGVRIVEPILDAMGIAHHRLETEIDVGKIRPAIDNAYARSAPVALLIGRSPTPP
jgi:sulfopyruvate decarboxylase TPP-binding subunit